MVYRGICHGTLGELVQGPLLLGGAMHVGIVSLPIRKYSRAEFTVGQADEQQLALRGKRRCRRAIELYLDHHGKVLPAGRWNFHTELPEGKGMASSTADIVATIRCLDAIFKLESTPACIAALLRQIERSDSVFLNSYALYSSDRQEVIRCFAGDPKFHVCYIDEGYAVDTEAVTPALFEHYESHMEAHTDNLERTIDAFERHDLQQIAACATRSALLSQEVLPKKNFAALYANQERFCANGILVAHTGSILGYLYVDKPSFEVVNELQRFFCELGYYSKLLRTGF
jgi:uncharacterized protein involved in propanediol utilization